MEYEPKFMEWGIINRDNFKNIKDLPIKRWDPLSTVIIRSNEFGTNKRRLRYYGHYSYVSPIRGKRPIGFKTDQKKSDIKDVFKSITDGERVNPVGGEGYTIIIAEDEKRVDDPFLNNPHKAEGVPDSCKAVTLINRYPSMARIVDQEIKNSVNLPPNSKLAMGINLVTISRHFFPALQFNLIPDDVLSGIFISMKTAIIYCIEKSIDKDYYDIPVSPFFNIGTKVGGSQPRVHSQIYLDLNGDGHGSRLEGHLEAFKEMGGKCHLCESAHGEGNRVVLSTKYWTFFNTGSPIRNYHLRFHPNEHVRRFSQLKKYQFQDLAKSLKIIFKALDDLNIDKNRNILFNCCPYGYDADFHMFGDLIPHEIIGGAEMADDMRVARKLPEDVASEIRSIIP